MNASEDELLNWRIVAIGVATMFVLLGVAAIVLAVSQLH